MPFPTVTVEPAAAELLAGFSRVRRDLGVPEAFPAAVDAAAQADAAGGPRLPAGAPRTEPVDRRDLALVTIDPPGSLDLDQAFGARRRSGGGFVVWYAIADIGSHVSPGDPVDDEARVRGLTLYSPDARAPLHPNVLGEGAASLLPGEDRWALLWSIDLDADGTAAGSRVERAIVRSRAALGYPEVQAAIDDGTAEEPLMLLREIGLARLAQEEARGALSLDLPAQKVVARSGGYDLEYVTPPAVERWNAQVSLLTGMEAARIMIAGGVGLLRTLPPPEPRLLAAVRRSAAALGVPWPAGQPFAAFVRGLDRSQPGAAALLNQVARTLRGAGYVAFSGTVPEHGHHAAVAAPYSHVTAPIRRLCDRFTNEVVLALAEGRTPPEWATAALPDLPRMMGAARQRERALSNAALDFMEAAVLEHHVGEAFEATVTDIDGRGAVVQICEPAVLARMAPDGLALGDHVEVRLTAADPATRTVAFARA